MTCEDCACYKQCLDMFTERGMYIGTDAEEMDCFKIKICEKKEV